MNQYRYLHLVDLETSKTCRSYDSDEVTSLDDAYVQSLGRCATIETPGGQLYIAIHSRCAPKQWEVAGGFPESRPQVPWAAYRGFNPEEAAALAWTWIRERHTIQK